MLPPAPSRILVVTNKQDLRRALAGQRRPRRRARPRIAAPKGIERAYGAELARTLLELGTLVRRRLLPDLPELVGNQRARMDAARVDAPRIISVVIDDLEIGYAAEVDPQTRSRARTAAERIARQNRTEIDRATETVLGVRMERAEPWLTDELTNFVQRTSRLVKRVSADFFDRLEIRIEEGVRTGQSIDTIARGIERDFAAPAGEELGRVRRRARLIARDQVGSYTGELTRRRQQSLGVERYTWSTSKDERVRASHRERDGAVFDWDRPIAAQLEDKGLTIDKIDGPPGRPIQCRCVAIPVLEDLLGDL